MVAVAGSTEKTSVVVRAGQIMSSGTQTHARCLVAGNERLALTNQPAVDLRSAAGGVDVPSSRHNQPALRVSLAAHSAVPLRGRAADPPEDARRDSAS